MKTLEAELGERLQLAENRTQKRTLTSHDNLLSFGDNDYFNLSQHPDVILASTQNEHIARSSRLLDGNHPAYTALESLLSHYKKTESALVFGSGYLATLGVITSIAGPGDLILADKQIHACAIDAMRLCGATFKRFSHNNASACEHLLSKYRKSYKHCFILTETIFSMDGDVAPLDELFSLANNHDCILITDDAHGIGITDNHMQQHKAHIQIGTMSKGLGSYGGYVCAPKYVIDYLINHARSFIFSTSLPYSVIAGALKALELLIANPQWPKELLTKAQYLGDLLEIDHVQSPIIPYIVNQNDTALALSKALLKHGIYVPAIRPPTVPSNTARLRISVSLRHTDDDIMLLCNTLKQLRATL